MAGAAAQALTAPEPVRWDELARRYARADAPRLVNLDPPAYQVGQVDSFWVARHDPPDHYQIEAELRLITRHAYWYVERGVRVSEAALRRSADTFEQRIYPAVRRLVGAEDFPGIDNDPRITVLSGNVPGVAGYVSSSDGYPRAAQPFSNEREMVYLNVRSLEPGSAAYAAVLAHEFTHLVHGGLSPGEATWIKEGLAEAVSSLVVPSRRSSYGAFFNRPDTALTSWTESPGGSESYESAALFLRYFIDRFGQDALYPLLTRQPPGLEGIDRLLAQMGEDATFESLFADWTIANLVGSASSPGVPGYRDPPQGSPRTQRVQPPAQVRETVAQFGADYYEVLSPRTTRVRFQGETRAPLSAAAPRSGRWMWHSGRQDAAVASLVRRFDLTGLDQAELRFWTWYDIEPNYDFAYVSVSTDEGNSWTLLDGPGMSRHNGSGNNLGQGFTGRSGGGAEPVWTPVSIDLRPFLGRPILLQFSYVTDDAVTRDGIALDDIELVPLGFRDGAEDDSAGWTARGWSRLPAEAPQRWMVHVVTFKGPEVSVQRLLPDGDGRAEWSAGGAEVERAVVIVSGTTAESVLPATYSLEFLPEVAEASGLERGGGRQPGW